jgi:hypothetical protein
LAAREKEFAGTLATEAGTGVVVEVVGDQPDMGGGVGWMAWERDV